MTIMHTRCIISELKVCSNTRKRFNATALPPYVPRYISAKPPPDTGLLPVQSTPSKNTDAGKIPDFLADSFCKSRDARTLSSFESGSSRTWGD